LSVNGFSLLPVLCLSLALFATSPCHADTTKAGTSPDRAALTRATLELQRDLLLTVEKYRPEERFGLNIYLSLDNLAKINLDSISISIDGTAAIRQELDQGELDMLMDGAMKRLAMLPLSPGKHILQTTLQVNGRSITKTVELNKSAQRDNLKITVTSLPQQHTPDITYTHETWAAAK
jgi:hypothetical protein